MNDAIARETMIDTQVRPNDVTDRRIHAALRAVPRETFLPRTRHSLAYAEVEHETTPGRYIWRARDFAKLLQETHITPDDVVLCIAAGSGYAAAVLGHLAGAVIGVESASEIAGAASDRLSQLNIDNADVVVGDLAEGLPEQAPFDVIYVNGAVEEVPQAWLDQLEEGGRLAVIVREGRASHARIYIKANGATAFTRVFDAMPPLLEGFRKKSSFAF